MAGATIQQSFNAGALIGGILYVIPDAVTNPPADARISPDNINTVWPVPHDAKFDTIQLLNVVFDKVGLTDVQCSKDGAFTAAQLADLQGNGVPYITVIRSNDVEVRFIDTMVGTYAQGDPALIDEEGIVPPNGAVAVNGGYSTVTIDVVISDTSATRADQMFLFVKYAMEAGLAEFRSIGYLDVKRVSGTDGAKIEINGSAGPFVVFNRTLTYEMKHPSFIAYMDGVVALLQQSLNTNEKSPDASITTNL